MIVSERHTIIIVDNKKYLRKIKKKKERFNILCFNLVSKKDGEILINKNNLTINQQFRYKTQKKVKKKFGSNEKRRNFALANQGIDQVAQPVEHIPFKDGVLGSSPSLVTDRTREADCKSSRLFCLCIFLFLYLQKNFNNEKITFPFNYFMLCVF